MPVVSNKLAIFSAAFAVLGVDVVLYASWLGSRRRSTKPAFAVSAMER